MIWNGNFIEQKTRRPRRGNRVSAEGGEENSSLRASRLLFKLFIVVLFVGWAASSASAGVKTWQTPGSGDWFDTTNWAGNVLPVDGDNVLITNAGASVILSSSTPALSSVTLSQTMVFTNWDSALNATSVTVQNGGVMTLPGAFTDFDMSNNVYVVCSNFTIEAGGSITADGNGYAGGAQALIPILNGWGPGAGTYGKFGAGGGGYGGAGGTGFGDGPSYPLGGAAYGSTNAPVDPGSGGGGSWFAPGVAGGGAVRIQATGRVTVNGSISANGMNAPDRGGGGSGGGIYIVCNVFGGNSGAVIRAKGGSGNIKEVGAGGGGRIAVVYHHAAQRMEPMPKVQIVANAGVGYGPPYSENGMIYFPDTVILNGGLMPIGILAIPATSWGTDHLTLGGFLRFNTYGLKLTVTNALTITGSQARLSIMPKGEVHCGSLSLTNGGAMDVCAPVTNGAYGALVSVVGDVDIASNSWINLTLDGSTNGASMRLVMRNLTIQSGAGLNANGEGYAGGPTDASDAGIGGPGSGPGAGDYGKFGAGGGGYGGIGGTGYGDGYHPAGGSSYGSMNIPVDPGSGGGGTWSTAGGRGGGAVQIVAEGRITVNGTITANGADTFNQGGGGSGGGIYISCNKFGGSPTGILSPSSPVGRLLRL